MRRQPLRELQNATVGIQVSEEFHRKVVFLRPDCRSKGKSGIRAAVIREKGCQCERETSYALYLAGFDVKDVHMTDLASGRETLEDVNMIVFCGGFSNSDVLGSAKDGPAVSYITRKPRKRWTTSMHVLTP